MADTPATGEDGYVGEYDPAAAPRSLVSIPDPQVVAANEQREQILNELLAQYDRQRAMFKSAGWRATQAWLEVEMQRARDYLEDDRINTIEAIANVRGQLTAYKFLIALPHLIEFHRDATKDELSRLVAAREV